MAARSIIMGALSRYTETTSSPLTRYTEISLWREISTMGEWQLTLKIKLAGSPACARFSRPTRMASKTRTYGQKLPGCHTTP
ncbi:protein of unknown function [Azospirillum baldaniorum]|uniref:Uncharacterized protein n=1 Tax=Azospirillum baldaniorum TaxID=1064539 RepID=A0A9P1JTB5_9PROT|nr:protein of unknown function [Azospirillum baldaniorum]